MKYSVRKEDLEKLFPQYGEVVDVKVIYGKGFAIVEMSQQSEADKAMEVLNNIEYKDSVLKIDETSPPPKKPGYGQD